MQSDSIHSSEGLGGELEQQKTDRLRALGEIDHRRYALALDQLIAASSLTGDLDQLLRTLLRIFAKVAQVDVMVVRVREGDGLRSRASFGMEEEVAGGFSVPVAEAFPGTAKEGNPEIFRAEPGTPAWSDFMRAKGIGALHFLPLAERDQLIGIVYVGTPEGRDLSEEDTRLLNVVGVRANAAITRHLQSQAFEQTVRSRDEILSVVAHDLQNPINVISIAANTLLQRLPDSSARRPLDRIIRGAQRADRLIRDLLEVNAIEWGRFSIERGRVEPADLILSALDSQQSLAADGSVIIGSDLSPELPPIHGDEERLLEVLENLIGNALKFTSAGGSITVGAAARESDVLIWVKDSGAGMAPEHLLHIFDRFWQAKKAERRGTGLGLTICKGIIEAHGGRIWAESELNSGTTFFLTIPLAPRAQSDGEVEVANILLVDDRPENLLALTAILERPEYRLVTATSGPEALSIALREHFAVALIDVAMPTMNGLEVAVHLKELERSRDIPVIFVTAFGSDPEEIHRAYSAGGADYLVKPLDAEVVRKKVAVFVALSRRRTAGERSRPERLTSA